MGSKRLTRKLFPLRRFSRKRLTAMAARRPAAWLRRVTLSDDPATRRQSRPMPKHLPLPVDARHFDRWLELFEATAADVCPPAAAAHFIERARRIAESLELGIAGANGVLLGKGERYLRPTEAWTPDA